MHMQSRVLKNERRLFAWRGGRGTRSCEELLWLGMNNVCRVNSQPRAWLCCPSLEGLTLLCTTLCLPAVVRRAYPCPAASCYIAQLLFKKFLMSNRNSFTLYSYYFGTNATITVNVKIYEILRFRKILETVFWVKIRPVLTENNLILEHKLIFEQFQLFFWLDEARRGGTLLLFL